ncbi:MAG: hypothetical protein N2323_03900 [candidate division WOR-3 bacterium]|nr:hypothetical protein [candidate division WOR-3 bacterium]MCX7837084.1 hypothetical protein [candidate division WOR-3 bacterium]MDW8114249.1 hypothetical protein [candidate division WOR-3 bacterium]
MKILFISYYFPPLGGVGVIRISKFIKYFKRKGYKISVITVKEIPYYLYDEDLLKEIEGINIYQVESLDFARLLYYLGIRKKFSYAGTTYSHFLNKLLFPDAKIGFLPFCYFFSKRIIEKEKPSFIFTTSPPYTNLLIGLFLKKKFSIPLISDFRDPYPTGIIPPPFYFKKILDSLRKKIVEDSEIVLSCHYEILKVLGNKAIWLPNGYDPEDFIIEEWKFPTRSIFYAGNLEKNSKEIFLLAEDLKELPDLKIYLAGHIDLSTKKELINYSNIIYLGSFSHKEVCSLMKGADYLLYLSKPNQIVGLKLFEYIGAQRPIIFYGKISEEIKMLNEKYKIGYYYDEKLKEKIIKNEELEVNRNTSYLFSFPYLTERLIGIIKKKKAGDGI